MSKPLIFPKGDVDTESGNIGHVSVGYMRERLMDICDKIESGEYIRSNVHVVAETVHDTVELFRSVNQPVYNDPEINTVACVDTVTITIPDDQKLVAAYDHFVTGADLGFYHLCRQGILKANEQTIVYTNPADAEEDVNKPYTFHRPFSRWTEKTWARIDEEHQQSMEKYADNSQHHHDEEFHAEMEYIQAGAARYRDETMKKKQERKDKYAK